jgi:hypothetical protein
VLLMATVQGDFVGNLKWLAFLDTVRTERFGDVIDLRLAIPDLERAAARP